MTEPSTFAQIVYAFFALLALGGAVGMVTRRSPVASLLYLVVTLFSLAALFLLLGAQFIAAVQIIVYAGAIMVLFLFVIMLLNLGHDVRSDLRSGIWIVAAFLAGGGLWGLLFSSFGPQLHLPDPGKVLLPAQAVQQTDVVSAIALPMLNQYVVAFELTAVLLLVAIVGAVLLAKRRV
ncbi:MAG: NADH-quinone oxidoreductase subunit J [Gemmatimonadota bacterium]|jgi:NADH-quinone oxidoreductase subunit J